MEVLVVGATGALGGRVTQRLLDRGHRVRAGSRRPPDTAARPTGALPVPCDVRVDAEVQSAVAGVDVVVMAAHGLNPGRGNALTDVDVEGCQRLLDHAQRAGVRHVVLCSVAGARDDHALRLFRAKAEAEQRVRATAMTHTIVRMAAFLETQLFEPFGAAVRRGRAVPVIGGGGAVRSWLGIEDAAQLVVEAALDEAGVLADSTVTLRGPTASTLEALQQLGQAFQRDVRTRNIPLPAVAAVGRLLELVRAPGAELVETIVGVSGDGDPPGGDDGTLLRSGDTSIVAAAEAWERARRVGTAATGRDR